MMFKPCFFLWVVGGGANFELPIINCEYHSDLLFLCYLHYDNRTCVNGKLVEEKTLLKHGDRILWGNNHYFRINCPRPPGLSLLSLIVQCNVTHLLPCKDILNELACFAVNHATYMSEDILLIYCIYTVFFFCREWATGGANSWFPVCPNRADDEWN